MSKEQGPERREKGGGRRRGWRREERAGEEGNLGR